LALRPGANKLGLGWWCWACRANQHMQIISLYCPCKANGPTTTYQQHVRAYQSRIIMIGLKTAILWDLIVEIKVGSKKEMASSYSLT